MQSFVVRVVCAVLATEDKNRSSLISSFLISFSPQDRLYYVALKHHPRQNLPISEASRTSGEMIHKQVHFFNIDTELVYWNFFLDFGPLNLGQLYRFCTTLNAKLSSKELESHVVCFYSSMMSKKRANAIYLICAWQVLYLGRTPEESFRGFMRDDNIMDVVSDDDDSDASPKNRSSPPPSPRSSMGAATVCALPPFHDASPGICTYDLNILDCLNGLSKARMYGFFDFDNFDVDEYEHFEQVEVSSCAIGNRMHTQQLPCFLFLQ